jgi:hypothetical protein
MRKQIALLREAETPRKNSVGHADSVEKILNQISMLSPDPVTYTPTTPAGKTLKQRVYDGRVNAVLVTPSLFRHFICTSGCTACCQKFTLDYTPSEYLTLVKDKTGFSERQVLVNGKKKTVWTNDQNQNPICDFLTVIKPGGGLGCAHWPAPPLSCVSAPQLQFIQMRYNHTYVLKKPYGRAWAMTPTPQCQFVQVDSVEDMHLQDLLDILDRFAEWARYFGIKTAIPQVQKFIRNVMRTGMVPTVGIPVWERLSA